MKHFTQHEQPPRNQKKHDYKLRELIVSFWGEEKFHHGCRIISNWLQTYTKQMVKPHEVEAMCESRNKEGRLMTTREAAVLIDFFCLKNVGELANNPLNILK